MTKITSAQRISAGLIGLRAFGLVPAERALKPGRRRQIASAVGLRHWLRLQTNRRLVTLDPVVDGVCGWDSSSRVGVRCTVWLRGCTSVSNAFLACAPADEPYCRLCI